MAAGDPELFREVFGRFATGVAVVTSASAHGRGRDDRERTVLACRSTRCSRSCASRTALATLPIVREAGRFGRQRARRPPGGGGAECSRPSCRSPRSSTASPTAIRRASRSSRSRRWVVCSLRELIAGGDHTIAIGEVRGLGLGAGDPLLVVPQASTTTSASERRMLRVGDSDRPSSRRAPAARRHERRQRHHAELPPDDRDHDRPLLVLRQLAHRLRRTRSRAESSTICAEEIRNCSARNETSSGSTP